MTDVVHGGLRASELESLGIDPLDVSDLSANLNPFGPHQHVLSSAREADVRHYPEAHAEGLRDALAAFAHVEPAQLLVTPGSTAALHLIARAFLREGDACALWPPTFGEYAAAIEAAGATVREYPATAPDFVPVQDIEPSPLGIFCNPNNPTGTYLDRASIEAIADRLGGPLVLDVAYDPFVEAGKWDADALVGDGRDVLVVHSMTKLHAVPGIRLGYIVGPEAHIARLTALQPSWSIDATAIAAGHAMLTVDRVQREATRDITGTRALIASQLTTQHIEVVEGRANFLLVRVGDAAAVRLALLRRGFAVRDCTSFGLPEWIRIAIPVEVAGRRLANALVAVLAEQRA
ncbi:MAG: histidinol-phosphate aminotransferase family protein [Chloroflexi bacterium]|nr:MAG: histidinol-phosphate aminotransferase family protein [Chloroflexota bacterium]